MAERKRAVLAALGVHPLTDFVLRCRSNAAADDYSVTMYDVQPGEAYELVFTSLMFPLSRKSHVVTEGNPARAGAIYALSGNANLSKQGNSKLVFNMDFESIVQNQGFQKTFCQTEVIIDLNCASSGVTLLEYSPYPYREATSALQNTPGAKSGHTEELVSYASSRSPIALPSSSQTTKPEAKAPWLASACSLPNNAAHWCYRLIEKGLSHYPMESTTSLQRTFSFVLDVGQLTMSSVDLNFTITVSGVLMPADAKPPVCSNLIMKKFYDAKSFALNSHSFLYSISLDGFSSRGDPQHANSLASRQYQLL